MTVTSEAHRLSSQGQRRQPLARWFWAGAFIASVTFHAGFIAALRGLSHLPVQARSTSETTSIPVELVELSESSPPSELEPSPEPSVAVLDEGSPSTASSSNPVPTASAPILSMSPQQERSPSPSAAPEPPSPSPQSSPQPEAEPSQPNAATSPEPSTAPSTEPSTAPSTATATPPLTASDDSLLPELPTSVPGDSAPSPDTTLPLPSINVARATDPVEITASISVRPADHTSDSPPAEQSDRQTFAYDPTGQSGVAIARCPLTPEVQHHLGETVTFQVQLDGTGGVAATDLYKPSSSSLAYEEFASCVVENWDFSNLSTVVPLPDSLLVSVTIEDTEG